LAGERIAARKDASTWLAQSESNARDLSRKPNALMAQLQKSDAR
jgi:hypothetical protein